MQEIINALKIAACIIGVVYGFKWLAAYCKHKMQMCGELDAQIRTRNLRFSIEDCSTPEELEGLMPEIKRTLELNRRTCSNADKLAKAIWIAYFGRKYHLKNEEAAARELQPILN